jgi:hypothetical protein
MNESGGGCHRASFSIRGRTRIDRIAEVSGGVPRLVSRPRKKRTKTLDAETNLSYRMAA